MGDIRLFDQRKQVKCYVLLWFLCLGQSLTLVDQTGLWTGSPLLDFHVLGFQNCALFMSLFKALHTFHPNRDQISEFRAVWST